MITKAVLRLGRGVRVQYEKITRNHVLLFPEGCVDLNESAKEVLTRLPSTRDQLATTLQAEYGSTEGLGEFLDEALRMKWIRTAEPPRRK